MPTGADQWDSDATDARVVARWRVRETIERYFHGVDAVDRELISSCFASDAVASYHVGTRDAYEVSGGQMIADGIYRSCAQFTASNHSLSNCAILVQEKEAQANTFAIANVERDGRMLVRGLRYQDRLIPAKRGWLIVERKHVPLWQFEQAPSKPEFFR